EDEQVVLRGPTGQEQEDDPLGARLEMGRTIGERVLGRSGDVSQHRLKRQSSETAAGAFQKPPAAERGAIRVKVASHDTLPHGESPPRRRATTPITPFSRALVKAWADKIYAVHFPECVWQTAFFACDTPAARRVIRCSVRASPRGRPPCSESSPIRIDLQP